MNNIINIYVQINNIYDLISLSVILLNIFSFYMIFFYDLDFLLGTKSVLFGQYFIKNLTKNINISILHRPIGAYNCNLYNTDGNVEGHPGFPSGHMASTSFMTNLLYLKYSNHKNLTNYFLYNCFNIFICISRYQKNCHNLFQIIGGYIFGFIIAYLFYNKKNIYHYIENKYIK